jgi:GAF domain-containing protein
VTERSAPEDMAAVFQRLQSLLLSLDDTQTFLQQLTELAAGVVNPPASCGITMRRDGQPLTVASSDETQYQAAEGPCLHSLATGQVVDIPDVEIELRWSEYLRAARESGLRCSLSLPLVVQGVTLGAMNIYGFEAPNGLDGELRQRFDVFAAQASGALQLVSMQQRDAEQREQLEQALASRTIIDQALGILMGQQRCTAEEAFALLRMRSQSSQQKLRDVAADLVTRVGGQPPSQGKMFDRG